MAKKLNLDKVGKTVEAIANKTQNIESGNDLRTINLNEIVENKYNSLFRALSETEMDDLKASIQEVGLLEPLVVVKEKEQYRLISGHQRKKALEELGITKVAVNVIHLSDDDDEQLALIHANIKQRKLSDIELARVIKVEKEIIQEKIRKGTIKGQGRAIEQVAQNLEISPDKAKRLDRLNSLIPELQKLVEDGKINTGKAQELGLIDKETQFAIYAALKEQVEELSLEDIKNLKKQSKEEADNLREHLKNIEIEKALKEDAIRHQENKIESLQKEITSLRQKESPEEITKLEWEIEYLKEKEQELIDLQANREKQLKEEIQALKDSIKNPVKSPYEQGFDDGYIKALKEIKARDKELISNINANIYEAQYIIERTEILNSAKSFFSDTNIQKDFLDFVDNRLFKINTEKPKNKLYFNTLGDWILVLESRLLFDIQNLDYPNLTISDMVKYAVIEYCLNKFTKEK